MRNPPKFCCLAVCLLTACIHDPVTRQEEVRSAWSDLERRVVYTGAGLRVGMINSITTIPSAEDFLIAVGGHTGAAFLTRAYAQTRVIPFVNVRMATTVPVDVERDGELALLHLRFGV